MSRFRRLLAALLCATTLVTCAWVPFTVSAGSAGDANGDNTVNMYDVMMLFAYSSSHEEAGIDLSVCDLNADKVVNTLDTLMLYKSVAGDAKVPFTTPGVTVRKGITNETVYMKNIKVYNEATGKTFTGDTKENLQMAVAEIVRYETGMSTFAEKSTEGWKAMAVAAYTVLARHCYNGASYNIYMSRDINLNDTTDKRIYNAVGEVLGIKIAYNDPSKSAYGQLCQVFYSASSAGTTCSTLTAWGYTELPYLLPVQSYYDNPEWIAHCSAGIDAFIHRFTIPMDELKTCLKRWIGVDTIHQETRAGEYALYATKQDGPYMAYSNLYYYNSKGTKKYVSGTDIYTAVNYYHPTIHCYSPAITVTGESNGSVSVETRGNGHGIGMSQYGMAGYANEAGWTYDQIIAHYFCMTETTPWGLVGPKW